MSQNPPTDVKNSENWFSFAKLVLSKMSPRELSLLGAPFLLFFISLKFSETKGDLNYALGFSSIILIVFWGYIFIKRIGEDKQKYQNLENSYDRIKEASNDLLQTMNEEKNKLNTIKEHIEKVLVNYDIDNNEESLELKNELENLLKKIENQQKNYDTRASRMEEARELLTRSPSFYKNIVQKDRSTNSSTE